MNENTYVAFPIAVFSTQLTAVRNLKLAFLVYCDRGFIPIVFWGWGIGADPLSPPTRTVNGVHSCNSADDSLVF